jgi:prepilin-type N-terminal cleavage/methylation domain-containing protein
VNCQPRRSTSGYTLFELMIVLAILAIVTAISLPMLRRPLSKSRLQDGAQQLSKSLADLRLVAMQEGRPYLFRYQMGGAAYQSCPAELFLVDPDQLETDSGELSMDTMTRADESLETGSDPFGSEGDGPLAGQSDFVDMQSLPDGLRFFDAELDTVESRLDEQAVKDRQLVEVPESYPESTAGTTIDSARWSTPVLFYPDGRATSIKLTVISDEGYEVDVTLRGLTGSVSAGTLRPAAGAVADGAFDDAVAIEGEAWDEEIPEQPIP